MQKHNITYLGVLQCKEEPVVLTQSFHFSDLPYFSRSQAKNVSTFMARELSKRVDYGFTATTVDEYLVYSNKWSTGLCILCICNSQYPARTAFGLLQHSFFIFNDKYCYEDLKFDNDLNLSLPELKELILKYKNPEAVDMYQNVYGKVQNTINIVHKTVKDLLNCEENLESLVNQSKDLSSRTKDVFAKSKKLKRRSCCSLM
ncbi:synaptobrevin-like protein, putative [Theileria annulata]|uniref:Synaptobrevin-like protein, putative n=1 Tax=Theileria annulata TaxID=5874 RepID=Q4UFQ4_THEAN|nr:synaptobrevin-like protein, putative [Theileria annulata]CAI74062.1 synaptobrevin-like protein, putative [Theileria annulata]|eukprot:XP_951794.1 synaptobrevin-like protein, putative [Theileria annulata]